MKKPISIILCLAMTFSLLAGCGSTESTSSTTSTDSSGSGTQATTDSSATTDTQVDTSVEPDGIVPGSEVSFYSTEDCVTQQMPGQSPSSAWMYCMVYDTLFYSPSGDYDDITGLLVEDYTVSEDNRVWVLNLHEDVTFANGNAMTAQTVYDCLEVLCANGQTTIFEPLESYGVTGDYQLTFTYVEPNAEFPYQVAVGHLGIFDPTMVMENGVHVDSMYMAGTGPYYISDYATGDYMTFTANPNYWNADRMAHIETVNCKVILDSNTQITTLASGEMALGSITDYINYETISMNDDLTIIDYYGAGRPMFFNVSGLCPELSNIRVREALTMMIDIDEVSLATSGGYGGTFSNAFNDGVDYEHTRIYDPEGALAILEEEGVDPADIVLTGIVDAPVSGLYTNLQAQFAECGVTLNFSVQDSPAVMSAGWAGEWDIWSESGGVNRYTYLSPITMMFGETGMHNMCRDPEIDPILWELIAEAAVGLTREDAAEKYVEIAKVLDESYAYIGNVRVPSWYAYNDTLTNVIIDQNNGGWRTWDAWIS